MAAKRTSRWPLIAAATAGALVTLVVVSVGGDDDTKKPDDVVDPTVVVAKPDEPPKPDDTNATKPPIDANTTKPPPSGDTKNIYPVAFSSTPPGAQVWIRMDKRIRLLCNTPCTFKLPTGKEVLVELKLDGYKSAQGTVIVAEGARFDASFKRK